MRIIGRTACLLLLLLAAEVRQWTERERRLEISCIRMTDAIRESRKNTKSR